MLRRPRMTSSNSIGLVFPCIGGAFVMGPASDLPPPAREQVAGWAKALLRRAHHLNISIARMVSTGTLLWAVRSPRPVGFASPRSFLPEIFHAQFFHPPQRSCAVSIPHRRIRA